MASTLRKRLGRKATLPEMKNSSDGEGDSASSSEVSLKAPVTDENTRASPQDQRTIALDDLSTTPPPNRKLRSSRDFSRDKTPPQSLLEKYKAKTAKQAIPTTTASKRKDSGVSGTGKGRSEMARAMSGDSQQSLPPTDSKLTPDERLGDASRKTGETRRVQGTDFDMLDHSCVEAFRQAPTRVQKSVHRRTRSKSRREEMERKKARSTDDKLSDELEKKLQLDTSLEPPLLSIRKVDRTPSPRAEAKGRAETSTPARDGLWDSARKLETEQHSPRDGLWDSALQLEKQQQLSPRSRPSLPEPTVQPDTRNTSLVDQAVANLIAVHAPQTRTPTLPAPSPSSSPQSDTSIHTPPLLKKSILKKTSSTTVTAQYHSTQLSIPIEPPIAIPGAISGYIFCSALRSSSRPVEPWAWCKRWTCCACGPPPPDEDRIPSRHGEQNRISNKLVGVGGDGVGIELNGRGERKAAATVAEQRVCSRIACGHVRCAGCWVEREARFEGLGPFGR